MSGVMSGSHSVNASGPASSPVASGVVFGASYSPARLVLQTSTTLNADTGAGSDQKPQLGSARITGTRYHTTATGSGVASTNKWGESVSTFKKTMYANHARPSPKSTGGIRKVMGVRASNATPVEASVDLKTISEEESAVTGRFSFSEYLSQQAGSPDKIMTVNGR